MNVKRVFHDDRTGPDAIHQFVFGNKFSRRLGQDLDDLERPTTDRYRKSKNPEFTASKVDLALFRGVNRSSFFRRSHAHGPPCGFFHLAETLAADRMIAAPWQCPRNLPSCRPDISHRPGQRLLSFTPLGLPYSQTGESRAARPCRFDCADTVALSRACLELGQRLGLAKELEDLVTVLSWPIEWSSLHGIAEIKTPILKLITVTDTFAHKHTVKRSGDSYPGEGAVGLAFPYHRPKKNKLSSSPAFRRGLAHEVASKGRPDANLT